MAYIVLTKDNFDQEVLRTEGTVLVDFWASWCGPCMALAPTIDEIAQRLGESREQIAASIDRRQRWNPCTALLIIMMNRGCA